MKQEADEDKGIINSMRVVRNQEKKERGYEEDSTKQGLNIAITIKTNLTQSLIWVLIITTINDKIVHITLVI